MGRLLFSVLVALALASMADAHRHLHQTEEAAVASTIPTAVMVPTAAQFGPEHFAPTNPELAATLTDTEVHLANATGDVTSQSAAEEFTLSAADAEAIKAMVAGPVTRCGNPPVNRTQRTRSQRQMVAALREREVAGVANTAVPNIGIWFHVIRRGTELTQGNIPEQWIDNQVAVLNAAFAGRFTFTKLGTTRTTNLQWYPLSPATSLTNTAQPEIAMKALRRGGPETLNFYTSLLQDGLLGWATLPVSSLRTDAARLRYDGVVCGWSTLPGSTAAPFNLGDTGTHEVGHWLNLLHTFEGGCSDTVGDLVPDTPAEASPARGCPQGRDTCRQSAGQDPITNFMDYTDDACMDRFSAGQFTRMNQAWNAFRASSTVNPPPTCSRFAAPGGQCGTSAGGVCCSTGQCCSQWGWCGVTSGHCAAGCQRAFGTCS